MQVAISEKPLLGGHKVRGVGFYTQNLINALERNGLIDLIKFTTTDNLKNADVVHYTWFDLFFKTLPIKKPIPTVVTIHDVIPLIFPDHFPVGVKGKINLLLQKISLKSCKAIITVSQNSKKDIIKYLGIKEEKIKVVLSAADDNFRILPDADLIRYKNKYKLPDEYLLYVGDVNYSKNLPFMIKGFSEIKKKEQFKNLKLLLVGQAFLKKVDDIDHPELKSIKEVNNFISSKKLESEIIRLGFIGTEDLIGIYNLATIYIQPSLYEGFGLPVLEAMKCGTPVLCSNTSSLPEIGGVAAIYFNPQNLEKFVSILDEVLRDKSLRKKSSLRGKEQADRFSWERVANETIKVYEQAIR